MYRNIVIPEKADFTINLPADYVGKHVEILAFSLEEEAKKSSEKSEDITRFYQSFSFDLKKLKFNREEANER